MARDKERAHQRGVGINLRFSEEERRAQLLRGKRVCCGLHPGCVRDGKVADRGLDGGRVGLLRLRGRRIRPFGRCGRRGLFGLLKLRDAVRNEVFGLFDEQRVLVHLRAGGKAQHRVAVFAGEHRRAQAEMRRAHAQRHVQNAATIADRSAGDAAVLVGHRPGREVEDEPVFPREENERLILRVVRRGHAAGCGVEDRVRYEQAARGIIRRGAGEREWDGVVDGDKEHVLGRKRAGHERQQQGQRQQERYQFFPPHARRLPSKDGIR